MENPPTRTSHAAYKCRPRLLCNLASHPHVEAPPTRTSHPPPNRGHAYSQATPLETQATPTLPFGLASYCVLLPLLLFCIWAPPLILNFAPPPPIVCFGPASCSALWPRTAASRGVFSCEAETRSGRLSWVTFPAGHWGHELPGIGWLIQGEQSHQGNAS